jgi:acetoin utilization protein AcuB
MDVRKPDHCPSMAAVMTPFPFSVQADDPVARAEELMKEHGIRHVPVRQGQELVGVLSERDLALRAGAGSARETLRVRDVCVMDAYVVDISARLDAVALAMAERQIGSALVTKHGRLAGIFTVTDACRALGELLRQLFPVPRGDSAA